MTMKSIDLVRSATGWVLEGYVGHIVVAHGPVLWYTACGLEGYGATMDTEPSRVCPRCTAAVRERERARRAAKAGTVNQGRLF